MNIVKRILTYFNKTSRS